MTEPTAPRTMQRPSSADLLLIAVAVSAVSTSAPLIRLAAAPAMAVAFWRNAMASLVIVPLVMARHRQEVRDLDRRERRLSLFAGALLAAHFATWIPSLSFTSVASSVALVATQPVWAAVLARWRGEHVPRQVWTGIIVAVSGAVVLTGVDLSFSSRALFGDALALAGGALAAAYVTVGADVRRTVGTSVYTAFCYPAAAAILLVISLGGGQPLTGYSAETWWCLVGLTVGAQLLGHSVFNRVLRTTSPTVVSISILFEIVGATLLAVLMFDEAPRLAAVPAAVLIATGVVLVVRAGEGNPAVSGAPALE